MPAFPCFDRLITAMTRITSYWLAITNLGFVGGNLLFLSILTTTSTESGEKLCELGRCSSLPLRGK